MRAAALAALLVAVLAGCGADEPESEAGPDTCRPT